MSGTHGGSLTEGDRGCSACLTMDGGAYANWDTGMPGETHDWSPANNCPHIKLRLSTVAFHKLPCFNERLLALIPRGMKMYVAS